MQHRIVSVPFRGFVLSNLEDYSRVDVAPTVSVPFRGFVLSNVRQLMSRYTHEVSVPFRGFVLSNSLFGTIDAQTIRKFPSPFGVLFCLICSKARTRLYHMANWFPSPFGVLFCLI